MSEADSPNDQSGSPAPNEPVELTAAINSATSEVSHPDSKEGWQTIDFPGAMSVDAIPYRSTESVSTEPAEHRLAVGLEAPIAQGVIHYSSAEIDQAAVSFAVSAETPDDMALQQQLQNENAALRDRLAQVELDLVQQQIEWQLESARTHAHTDVAVNRADRPVELAGAIEPPSAFEPTAERLNQLLQELERSRQTAQRQQILVETLTEQLESSQERIAQLERDCALTQQRHNEQVQQVLQVEGACRDLRLRLHRQQQQTLQFKAALEKCLEMPTVYGQQVMPDVAIDDSTDTLDVFSALLKPRNQPVKPWSLPQRAADELASEPAELPKPLFRLLNGSPVPGDETNRLQESDALATGFKTPFSREDQSGEDQRDALLTSADPSALLDSDDPEFVTHLMQLIFPNTAEQQAYTTTDALQAEPILDLSPVPGTENAAMPPAEASGQGEVVSLERSTDWAAAPLEMTEPKEQQQGAFAPSYADAIANIPASAVPEIRSTDSHSDDLNAFIDPPETAQKTTAGADVKVKAHPDVSGALAQSSADRALDSAGLVPVEHRSVQAVPLDSAGITPTFTASAIKSSALDSATVSDHTTSSTTRPIAAWTWRDRLAKASATPRSAVPEKAVSEKMPQSPANLLALSSVSRNAVSRNAVNRQMVSRNASVEQLSESQEPVSVDDRTELTPTRFSTVAPSPIVTPSPIVYPLRSSTKKLDSLAAVSLPTFPRR